MMGQVNQRRHWASYLALGIGILSLSISPILVRLAKAPGAVSMFYRVGIAVVLLALPFFQRVKNKAPLPRRGIGLALLGGLCFSGDLVFWATGVMLSGATNPTLMASTAPVWVSLGAMVFFREKLPAKFWGGLALAMVGVIIVLEVDHLQAVELSLGTFYGLIAAVFYGSYFLVTQRGRQMLDSLTYFWIAALSNTTALLIFCLVLRQPLTGYTLNTYLIFLTMGILAQVGGFLSITFAQGYLSASIVSTTWLVQPMITALLAALLLGESFLGLQVLGGIVLLGGVVIVNLIRPD
jgi:drug/metabolite transporter (DMT)-like permease